MPPRQAALLTLLLFSALFAFQLLWTHGQLEQLRSLGRRGLRRRSHAAVDATASLAADKQGPAEGSGGSTTMPDPAVVVFAYNRANYLNQTLHSLLGLHGLQRYSVYVSQDGDDAGVAAVVSALAPTFLRSARNFTFWQKRPRVPALGPNQTGHAWLAQHYRWGLDRVFLQHQHSHVVIVEDDMLLSPDFLLYFESTAPLLDVDATLWCISSWNDNGFTATHDWNVSRLFRTSYFPGLGWMMKRDLWLELGPKWPLDHWDHWMRDDEVSQGRDCICPEVNRNRNIGEVGANMNRQAFRRYLQTMSWNSNQTVTNWGDLSYLLKGAYTEQLKRLLAEAQPYEWKLGRKAPPPSPGGVYYVYYTIEQYMRVAVRLKLWPYPRGHFQHIASIPWMGARFLLADSRFCPLVPADQRLQPSPGMRPLPGKQQQSCTDACAERGMLCKREDFWWLNSCSVLRRQFPCEHGCTIELGPDVPAYVSAPDQTLYKYCLITQKPSACSAKHAATSRLCPCVPATSKQRRRHMLADQPDSSSQQQQYRQQHAAHSRAAGPLQIR